MLRLNISPFQFLFPDSVIEVESDAPLLPRAARAGISVAEASGEVRLARAGKRALWTPDERLAPGHYTLHVRDLVNHRGKTIEERHVVPFTVIETKAKVRPSVRVESFLRARVDDDQLARLNPTEAARGPYVELFKGSDQRRTTCGLSIQQPGTADRRSRTPLQARRGTGQAARQVR